MSTSNGLPVDDGAIEMNGSNDEVEGPSEQYEGSTLAEIGPTNKKELCELCKKLDLTAEKFIVKNGMTGRKDFVPVPHRAEHYEPHYQARQAPEDLRSGGRSEVADDESPSTFSLKSRNGKQSLGTLGLIVHRSVKCPFCSLVRSSIRGDSYETYLDAKCEMNWELDGREVNRDGKSFQTRTRRIHLRWDNKKLQDAYLVFVAPEKFLRISSDAAGAWEREAYFFGRNIDSGSNHFLMKSWVDQCSDEHGELCAIKDDPEFDLMARQSFFGVIDVLDMCLKPLPPGRRCGYEPYIALSYVWGTHTPYTTTLKKILIHKIPGSLAKYISELPPVIQDAMNLVRLLGHRYLWVDSLCIVQDSNRSWKLNADVMDLIYGQAFLTICAADGEDSQTGLRAMHPGERSASQHIEECAPGVSLMLRELPETSINVSKWNTRAWTFQERLLSRRCLIFADGRAFFQCRSNAMSEDVVAVKKGAGWSLDLVQALPQILRELPFRGFRVYMNCVSLYSSRALTKSKDILAAFKGVSNLISRKTATPFVYGLPNSHFDLALLWEPARSLRRRQPRTKSEKQDFQDTAFPSWSWCGWEGGEIRYTNEMIDGCLANVHEWHQDHTWISWYIRDGHGNLRPLWHKDMFDSDHRRYADEARVQVFTEERWRGYRFPSSHGKRHEEEEDRIVKVTLTAESRGRQPTQPCSPMLGIYREERDAPRYTSPRRYDTFGRHLPPEFQDRPGDVFYETLRENPYQVVMAKPAWGPKKEFEDQPILQFWTWMASLHLVPKEKENKKDAEILGNGLERCDIADHNGDWCGSIVLDEKWVRAQEASENGLENSRYTFIALSDAKAFTQDECDVWTYYITSEREHSEWDLYYVFLVERVDPVWYRVGLGKVFKAAFANAGKAWKEIILG